MESQLHVSWYWIMHKSTVYPVFYSLKIAVPYIV